MLFPEFSISPSGSYRTALLLTSFKSQSSSGLFISIIPLNGLIRALTDNLGKGPFLIHLSYNLSSTISMIVREQSCRFTQSLLSKVNIYFSNLFFMFFIPFSLSFFNFCFFLFVILKHCINVIVRWWHRC